MSDTESTWFIENFWRKVTRKYTFYITTFARKLNVPNLFPPTASFSLWKAGIDSNVTDNQLCLYNTNALRKFCCTVLKTKSTRNYSIRLHKAFTDVYQLFCGVCMFTTYTYMFVLLTHTYTEWQCCLQLIAFTVSVLIISVRFTSWRWNWKIPILLQWTWMIGKVIWVTNYERGLLNLSWNYFLKQNVFLNERNPW